MAKTPITEPGKFAWQERYNVSSVGLGHPIEPCSGTLAHFAHVYAKQGELRHCYGVPHIARTERKHLGPDCHCVECTARTRDVARLLDQASGRFDKPPKPKPLMPTRYESGGEFRCASRNPHTPHDHISSAVMVSSQEPYEFLLTTRWNCPGIMSPVAIPMDGGPEQAIAYRKRERDIELVRKQAAQHIIRVWEHNGETYEMHADGPLPSPPDYEALSLLDPRGMTTETLIGVIDFLWGRHDAGR